MLSKNTKNVSNTFQKVEEAIIEQCSRIQKIDKDILLFITQNCEGMPSRSDLGMTYPVINANLELACSLGELYSIFDLTSPIITQEVKENVFMCNTLRAMMPDMLTEACDSMMMHEL